MTEKKTVEYTETKFKVRHISILSAGSVSAFIGVIFGLVYGVIVMAVGGPIGFGVLSVRVADVLNLAVGPIFGAVGGFIGGAAFAAVYNIAARFISKIEIELE